MAVFAAAVVIDGAGLRLFNSLPGPAEAAVVALTAALFLAVPGVPLILVIRHWDDTPDPLAGLRTPARTLPRIVGRVIAGLLRTAVMLAAIAATLIFVPTEVNAAAYLAGAGHTVTFVPVTNSHVSCGRSGCSSHTDGYLEGTRQPASWPNIVPVGRPFTVRTRIWDGPLTNLIGGASYAIGRIAFWFLVFLWDLLCVTQGVIALRPLPGFFRRALSFPRGAQHG